jgi:hypothetical protein
MSTPMPAQVLKVVIALDSRRRQYPDRNEFGSSPPHFVLTPPVRRELTELKYVIAHLPESVGVEASPSSQLS